MTNIGQARKALVSRVLEGDGHASRDQRRAAYDNAAIGGAIEGLVRKVASRAHAITDEDFAAARASGASEEQLFELVVCAAIGQAGRQYETALAALDAASKEA
jgi:alkylhydroperoxidase family enzyme